MREHLGQQHRYNHCVRVARLADTIAAAHGADTRVARRAGMLHDLARLYDEHRLLTECSARAIPIDDYARKYPVVLHAPLGAALAAELFNERDEAVLSAIAKHTLAATEMSLLDCVLYLADSLEPHRRFAGRAELACLAHRDVAAAMAQTIGSSFSYLRERGLRAAPQTIAAARLFGVPADYEEALPGGPS